MNEVTIDLAVKGFGIYLEVIDQVVNKKKLLQLISDSLCNMEEDVSFKLTIRPLNFVKQGDLDLTIKAPPFHVDNIGG